MCGRKQMERRERILLLSSALYVALLPFQSQYGIISCRASKTAVTRVWAAATARALKMASTNSTAQQVHIRTIAPNMQASKFVSIFPIFHYIHTIDQIHTRQTPLPDLPDTHLPKAPFQSTHFKKPSTKKAIITCSPSSPTSSAHTHHPTHHFDQSGHTQQKPPLSH